MRRFLAMAVVVSTCGIGIAAEVIRPDSIIAHMNFLASDLLEGRATGTRGYDLAAEYVASQFQAVGLEPGVGSSYFQEVPLRRTVADDRSTVVISRDGAEPVTLTLAKEFMTQGDPAGTDTVSDAEVVFVGFGITAPERKHDDYAAFDVRGKIVAIFSGAPASFPDTLRAHYSASATKIENAAAHGAAGLFVISPPKDEKIQPWDRLVRSFRSGGLFWLEQDGTPRGRPRTLKTHQVMLSRAAAEVLFAGARTSFKDAIAAAGAGKLKGFPLATRARIHLVSKHQELRSPNVVGLLRGSDPKLKDEYIVYSGHLDHLGVSAAVDGDAINNGALDNASGIGGMIEIARAFAALPQRPKRSILFLATTAEEKGLRGADYFAANPTVPAANIVANINIDEFFMFAPARDVVVWGQQHSDLGTLAEKVATQMNLGVSPDPYPEEVIFVRSDQYPFVKLGVPAIYIGVGYKSFDPKIDLLARQREWMRTIYHSPKDDMSQPLHPPTGAKVAELDFRIGLIVANAPERPRWKKGDFFGDKFGRR